MLRIYRPRLELTERSTRNEFALETMAPTKTTIQKRAYPAATHRQLSTEAAVSFVLLLEGEYKHRITEVLSYQLYNDLAMVRVKTICSAGHELEVLASTVQHLPHGRRADVQASVLGRGVGNIQASFVSSKELAGVMLVSLAPDYNALMHSDMRMKTSMDDEVLHGAIVIGPLGRELRTVSKGGGKRKDYQQKFLLPFNEPKPLLVKVRDGVFVYAGRWELNGDFVVTHDEESAGVEQKHEDFGSLATGFQTKHYQLVYRGFGPSAEPSAYGSAPSALAGDAEQDEEEDEGVSCIDLTRRTAPPMARAVARQLGGGEGRRRGAKQPSLEEVASAAVPAGGSSSLQTPSNCPLVCPVSLEHMQDPVALPCGHAFERSAIESHLTTSKDCPVCRRRVPRGEITFGTATIIRDLTRAIEADPTFAKTLGCRCCE